MNKKQKRAVRRKVDLELGVTPPKTMIHKNKKKYDRKKDKYVYHDGMRYNPENPSETLQYLKEGGKEYKEEDYE